MWGALRSVAARNGNSAIVDSAEARSSETARTYSTRDSTSGTTPATQYCTLNRERSSPGATRRALVPAMQMPKTRRWGNSDPVDLD